MRGVTPLSLWGGDTLIYRSIIALACVALPLIAGVNWALRGTVSWPQLSLAGALLAIGLLCLALSNRGKREIAAVVLIGSLWISVTIYAFETGYGMHSAVVFIYLPCLLYTTLFFGLTVATAELLLTIAVLLLMYLAEESGRLGGAAQFVREGTNFNFLLGTLVTCVGTLVAAVVYHRRVEREAARVTAEAEQRNDAMEKAQLAQAQLETANAKLQALNAELAANARRHEQDSARARRDIDLVRDVLQKDIPRSLAELRSALAAPDEGTDARLQREIGRVEAVVGALNEIGRAETPPRRAVVDLSALAQELVRGLRARPRYARVRYDIEPGLRTEADRAEVAALLRHLVKRAASACQAEPEPLVHVGGGSREGRLVFYVRDNGPGMNDAQREKLFRPFERGRTEDTVDIGIVSARCIAERHAGDLWVESAPGRGTTYFFTLAAG